MPVKIALPKGRLLRKTAALLHRAGWALDEYHSEMGFYRPRSSRFPDALIRVFHEKDIPVQVAMGNYDLGICGLDWVQEMAVKFPGSDLVRVRDLCYGNGSLLVASMMAEMPRGNGAPVRIASEYPNLAGDFALRQRLSRFSIFPVWGAVEVYPPENADLALLPGGSALQDSGMVPVASVLDFSAFLIANRNSWAAKDLDEVLTSICDMPLEGEKKSPSGKPPAGTVPVYRREADGDLVRLALPDGHQQQPTVSLLQKAGIALDDYPSASGNRRPVMDMEGVAVKVIRPQDMPLQVANGSFDLAITGRDWLTEHLDQFPSSPVGEILDLNFARVRLVAVVSQGLSIADAAGLRNLVSTRERPLRVASEYVNIADRYARNNLLGRYQVIPTWGATEAFLPDDADLLIENTETGRTIARHNLKIIDTILVSTGCLIGRTSSDYGPLKRKRIEAVVSRLHAAVKDA
ncbi:MAG: hypothetical protein A2Z29_02690 [Chloroflexi bacterium RBG_16_56_11]|nr:MAG: hypothetical protein A2Z29_02690 [Chloroflexi bacterium RBG_16_56_11]